MTTKEALNELNTRINNCKSPELEELAIILALGAGHLSLLTEGGGSEFFLDRATELMKWELTDAIILNCNRDDEFVPIYCGDWESVLASLILSSDWVYISDTAQSLLKVDKLKDRQQMFPNSGFWEIERVKEKLV